MLEENKQTNASGDKFLQWAIVVLGAILVMFVGFFTYKMYFPTLPTVNVVSTSPVIISNAESLQQYKLLDKRISTVEQNVNTQLESYAVNTSFVNQQVSTLYSMFNNSLMIFTIILGFFTLIIAVFGFYISKVVEARYEIIRKSKEDVEVLKKSTEQLITGKSRELFEKIQELDTEKMLNSLRINPLNIGNIIAILSVRNITGDSNWKIIRDAFLSLDKLYRDNNGAIHIISILSLMFQFYPKRIVSESDPELLTALKSQVSWMMQISFFPNEFIKLIKEFKDTNDPELLNLLNYLVFQNQNFSWYIGQEIYSTDIVENVRSACTNIGIKTSVINRMDFIQKQLDAYKGTGHQYHIDLLQRELNGYERVLLL